MNADQSAVIENLIMDMQLVISGFESHLLMKTTKIIFKAKSAMLVMARLNNKLMTTYLLKKSSWN